LLEVIVAKKKIDEKQQNELPDLDNNNLTEFENDNDIAGVEIIGLSEDETEDGTGGGTNAVEETVPSVEGVIPIPKVKPRQADLDAMTLYLKEIGAAPLLTAEQEIELAQRAAAGDKAARSKMIESNLRLVVTVSRKYLKSGMELADLIEEGNIGLMHALEKFDPKMGYRFSTYATWWIRHNVERAIMNQSRTVRLPVHVIRELSSYKRKALQLNREYEHKPSDQDLADVMEQPIDRIRKVMSFSGDTLSLDSPMFSEDDGINYVDVIEDETQLDPVTTLEDEDLKSLMAQIIGKLDPHQYEVLKLRFGFENGDRFTLDEVAAKLGVSREKVRQVQEKALRTLRVLLSRRGVDNEIIE
jgi:RNA polymerase nonessential primary-like sigma factor